MGTLLALLAAVVLLAVFVMRRRQAPDPWLQDPTRGTHAGHESHMRVSLTISPAQDAKVKAPLVATVGLHNLGTEQIAGFTWRLRAREGLELDVEESNDAVVAGGNSTTWQVPLRVRVPPPPQLVLDARVTAHRQGPRASTTAAVKLATKKGTLRLVGAAGATHALRVTTQGPKHAPSGRPVEVAVFVENLGDRPTKSGRMIYTLSEGLAERPGTTAIPPLGSLEPGSDPLMLPLTFMPTAIGRQALTIRVFIGEQVASIAMHPIVVLDPE